MREYLDFEVRLSGTPPVYEVYASGVGGNERETFTPPADAAFEAGVQQLAALDADEATLTQLGRQLFEALFHGNVKSIYDQSQEKLGPDQWLRLRINIGAQNPELARLPWEFLYDPVRGPLALSGTPIVRFLPQPVSQPGLKVALPLKVLLTAAQTPPPASVERELQEVRTALESLGSQVQVTPESHLTIRTFQRLLRENFHIWHFVGHGNFSPDGRTARLALEDDRGGTQHVGATELQIFLNRSSIRLIVLDACDSAKIATEPFRAMAPALIRAQIPAVVAMQFRVPEESTQAFAGEFYRTLAAGWPIDACVTEGRRAILGVVGIGSPDWGIPVVYTRAPDGKLFDLPGEQTAVVTPTQPQSGQGGASVNIQGSNISASNINATSAGTIIQGTGTPMSTAELEQQREIIRAKRRRLFELEKQKAVAGLFADPSISIQIEDLRKEIAEMERGLGQ